MELENKNDIERLNNEHNKLKIEEKLYEDLQIKFNKLDEKVENKNKEYVIKIRIKQYGIANIMVNLYNLDKNLLIISCYKLAKAYYNFSCFKQSEEYLIKSLNLNEENQNSEYYFNNQIIILKNLTFTYKKLKNYEEAYKLCEQVINLFLKVEDFQYNSEYYNILIIFGNLNRLLKRYEESDKIISNIYKDLRNSETKLSNKMKVKLVYLEYRIYSENKNYKTIDKLDELIDLIENNFKVSKKIKYFELILSKISFLSNLKSKDEVMGDLIKNNGMKWKNELFEINGRNNIDNIKYLKQIFLIFLKNKFNQEALMIINILEEILTKSYGENSKKLIYTYKEKSFLLYILRDEDKALKYKKKYQELEIWNLVKVNKINNKGKNNN